MKTKRNRKNKQFAFLGTLLICAVLLCAQKIGLFSFQQSVSVSSVADGVLYAHYIDVGQGDSELITTPSGQTVLIDAGPRSSSDSLVAYLKEMKIETITYFVLTHPHEDHIGGAVEVFNHFSVENTIMPDAVTNTAVFNQTLQAIENEGCENILAQSGSTYSVGNAAMTILAPLETDENNQNNNSVVIKLTYQDTAFLFCGDAETESEQMMLNHFTEDTFQSNVLKVAHHGSSTSTCDTFLSAVHPEYAIISCAKGNSYGHPHMETLNRLLLHGITCCRTDEDGTIIFSSDGNTVSRILLP